MSGNPGSETPGVPASVTSATSPSSRRSTSRPRRAGEVNSWKLANGVWMSCAQNSVRVTLKLSDDLARAQSPDLESQTVDGVVEYFNALTGRYEALSSPLPLGDGNATVAAPANGATVRVSVRLAGA